MKISQNLNLEMTLTFDLNLIFLFFWTKDLKSKEPRSLSLMVYQLQLHFTYFKYRRGNNSHMEFPDRFGQNYFQDPEDITRIFVK